MTDKDYTDWVGRTQILSDQLSLAPVRLMRATLDLEPDEAGRELPPLWHWLYFLRGERQSDIGVDGHPQRGGFLPPVTLPRRMWAGGRLRFLRALELGSAVQRISRILSVQRKEGRSGSLVFVTVLHEVSDVQGLAIREEQDIVYRDASASSVAPPTHPVAPSDEQFARTITPDPLLLMRYSALTFNGHRIHFDRPYAMLEEGYPGLVVHGPLIATLLMETLRAAHPDRQILSFDFKAVSPLFDKSPFVVAGRLDSQDARLWARGSQGQLAMTASATLA